MTVAKRSRKKPVSTSEVKPVISAEELQKQVDGLNKKVSKLMKEVTDLDKEASHYEQLYLTHRTLSEYFENLSVWGFIKHKWSNR